MDVITDLDVHRVVAVSSLGRGYLGRSGLLGAAFAMDTAIEAVCAGYRALRTPYFMDNFLAHGPAIATDGVVIFPQRRRPDTGDGRRPRHCRG